MKLEVNPSTQQLSDAFRLFSEMSEQLAGAYRELDHRVAALNAQLAAEHDGRLRELAEKERVAARLAQLLAALPAGVVVLDGAERVREHNPAARSLLGEPLLGRGWNEIAGRALPAPPDECGVYALSDGRAVSLVSCPLEGEPGRILLLQDITDTQRLRQTVEHHRRLSALGEMAAVLAHQIRTPLASALLYVSQISQPLLADKLLSRLRHMETMVRDLLLFARDGSAADHGRLSLGLLLAELRQSMAPQAAAAGQQLIVDTLDGDDAVIVGRRAALLGALQNLVVNALQANSPGCSVTVAAHRRADGRIELGVRDQGPGVPAALRTRVFEPFFTTRAEGTGLGLAVVRAVVEAHGGTVQVDGDVSDGCRIGISLVAADDADALPGGCLVSTRVAAAVPMNVARIR